jgi:hypothetical protein
MGGAGVGQNIQPLTGHESASISAQKNTPFNFYMDSYADDHG